MVACAAVFELKDLSSTAFTSSWCCRAFACPACLHRCCLTAESHAQGASCGLCVSVAPSFVKRTHPAPSFAVGSDWLSCSRQTYHDKGPRAPCSMPLTPLAPCTALSLYPDDRGRNSSHGGSSPKHRARRSAHSASPPAAARRGAGGAGGSRSPHGRRCSPSPAGRKGAGGRGSRSPAGRKAAGGRVSRSPPARRVAGEGRRSASPAGRKGAGAGAKGAAAEPPGGGGGRGRGRSASPVRPAAAGEKQLPMELLARRKLIICSNITQRGFCKWGAKCYYRHPTPPPPGRSHGGAEPPARNLVGRAVSPIGRQGRGSSPIQRQGRGSSPGQGRAHSPREGRLGPGDREFGAAGDRPAGARPSGRASSPRHGGPGAGEGRLGAAAAAGDRPVGRVVDYGSRRRPEAGPSDALARAGEREDGARRPCAGKGPAHRDEGGARHGEALGSGAGRSGSGSRRRSRSRGRSRSPGRGQVRSRSRSPGGLRRAADQLRPQPQPLVPRFTADNPPLGAGNVPCKRIRIFGSCHLGDRCWFKHPAPERDGVRAATHGRGRSRWVLRS